MNRVLGDDAAVLVRHMGNHAQQTHGQRKAIIAGRRYAAEGAANAARLAEKQAQNHEKWHSAAFFGAVNTATPSSSVAA